MTQRLSLILFAIMFYGACVNSQAQNAGNYADTLLHVGSVTVSRPFFNRDIRSYLASTKTNKADTIKLKNWYNNYINDLLLTNCAIDNGYLKRDEVEERAIGFENYVLIQKESSFYKANILLKVLVSPNEVNEAYNRMSTVTNFTLIRFANEATYHNALKGRRPSNIIFEELKNTNNDSIMYGTNILIWPSLALWNLQYQIASLKEGEISDPISDRDNEFSNAIYLIRVDSIRHNERKPFNLEKERLETILNKIKADSLYDYYEKAILQKANVHLNKVNFSDSLVQCFVNHSTDPKNQYFQSYLKVELMKYSLNGIPVIVTVHDFLTYYRNLPVRLNLKTRSDIQTFLRYLVLSSYMVKDASIANFDKEVRYMALKKDLRNKFALMKFEEDLFNQVSVSDKACKSYYQEHLQSYNSATIAKITVLVFDSENDAIMARMRIGTIDTASFNEKIRNRGAIARLKSHSSETVNYSDSLRYPESLLAQVFEAKNGTLCGPFKMHNQVVLVYKKMAYGNRLRSYKESKEQIFSNLKTQKYFELKDGLLKQAKEKYLLYSAPTLKQVEDLVQ